MLTKTRAFVLHSIKFNDASMIVDLFTYEHGRLAFVVRIPKTSKARVRKLYFQPLALLDVEYDYRINAKLQHLKEVSFAVPLAGIPFEPVKSTIALFLAEFLSRALYSEQHDAPLYYYIEKSILWLDACSAGVANFHLVFLLHLSRFLGFYPNLDHDGNDDFFDLRAGAFCQYPPAHADVLRDHEAALVRLMMRMTYENEHVFALSHSDRNRCLDIILDYYRLHLVDFHELKSLQVLREIFVG